MDMDKLRDELPQSIRESVAAWNKLPGLLESGWVSKSSGNWYRLKDGRALNQLSAVVQGFKADKSGKVTHIKLSKPRKKFIEFAEQNP